MGEGPRIALIGLRGCGKTTVGRALATLLQLPFLDSDEELSAQHGRSPAEILDQDGEPTFRRLESALVLSLLASHRGILALGGGAPLDPRAATALQSWTPVLLDVPDALLEARIRQDGESSRPALTDLSLRGEIAALRSGRWPGYLSLDPIVVAGSGAPEAVAGIIEGELRGRGVLAGG